MSLLDSIMQWGKTPFQVTLMWKEFLSHSVEQSWYHGEWFNGIIMQPLPSAYFQSLGHLWIGCGKPSHLQIPHIDKGIPSCRYVVLLSISIICFWWYSSYVFNTYGKILPSQGLPPPLILIRGIRNIYFCNLRYRFLVAFCVNFVCLF